MEQAPKSINALAMGRRAIGIQLITAAASGTMVAFLFPPFDISMLAWLALMPLLAGLWSVKGKRKGWQGFAIGGFAGLVSCGLQFHWFGVVSWLAAIIMPLYLALYWAVFGAFVTRWGQPQDESVERDSLERILHSLRIAFCTAAVWAGLEWLRSWLFTGFGWNPIGVAFHQSPVMAQSADLLGVIGLSMVPVFVQTVLLQTFRRLMHAAQSSKRQTRLDFGVAALVVGILICYGLIRLASERDKESLNLKTLLVQINIPQDAAQVLWAPLDVHLAYEEETLKALEALTAQDAKRSQHAADHPSEPASQSQWPDWVMWPESALSGSILIAEDGNWGTWEENMLTVGRVREAGPFQLIYGITEFEAVRDPEKDQLTPMLGGKGWNSLAVMGFQNELQTYRKHHLVLFGETIPFVDSIPFLKTIYEKQAGVAYGGSFTPGTSFDPLQIPLADGTIIHAIPTICFEDSVPRLTRKFLRPEAQVIINVTNDGWFKESAAAAQHFANAKFRAIEFRRPMLRCANNGVTAAIDSSGSVAHPDSGAPQILVDAQGSHFTRGSLLTRLKVPSHPSTTLYAIIGDWGVIGVALLGIATAIFCGRRDITRQSTSMQSP